MIEKNLTINLKVKNKTEAYQALVTLAYEHNIVSAEFDKIVETFNKDNSPFSFLKKKNPRKIFRDIKNERAIN